ncbi:transglycosylase domain-containing protein [Futiania mangrovi]|uniref:PBP1A family penicillin-binding protein n=1 Tax=Futiania mangrovi TaxID=2959716 RepID=A0A9J6P987_9PROT|nr:PBP1A family penicillin-binding protein [Futiania mangrovii]MCP1336460.1 PBP1A family penicillin-binding protein [Futiania mangrovii]
MARRGDSKGEDRSAGQRSARRPRRRPAGRGERARRSLLWRLGYWAVVAGLWLLIAAAGFIAWHAADLPDSARLLDPRESPSVEVRAVDGSVVANRGALYGGAVTVAELPRHLTDAVLAIEDRNFYLHPGFDPIGIARAAWTNLRSDGVVQGGSTITQQLAKNLFLTPERTFERKIKELILSVWLELRFTKDEILTIYLNRAYFGAGAYGVEAAAQRYFGVSARRATLPQAAMLAGLLKAPSRLAPTADLKAARARAAVVLSAMHDAGFIDRTTMAAAQEQPARLGTPGRGAGTGFFVDWVLDELTNHVGDTGQDLVVETTLDPGLQAEAEAAVERVLAADGQRNAASQGALVAMTPDGAVRAMVGGRSYRDSQYNRAVQARRQPGSAFKPIVYLAGLRAGLAPDSTMIDQPVRYGRYAPVNYSGRFVGPVTVAEALAQSINTIAVQITAEVGPPAVIRVAESLGITSPLTNDLSLALGASEVSLLELTQAYAQFANGGRGLIAHTIRQIATRDGRVLYRRAGSGIGPVMRPWEAAAMTGMMRGVIERGTGRAAQLAGREAAGKTGTSSDFRDAWFVGFTPELVAGVWLGNDDSSPMKKVTGGTLPARIWQGFMRAALDGLPPSRFPAAPPPPGRVPEYDGEGLGALAEAAGRGVAGIVQRVLESFGAVPPPHNARPQQAPREGSRVPPPVLPGQREDMP